MKLINVVMTTLLINWYGVHAASDPVFSPEVLQDDVGNRADRHSVIRWAPIQHFAHYTTRNRAYDDGGLQPLFDFANSFIDAVQPNDYPYG